MIDAVARHGEQERNRAADVVVVVRERNGGRFADRFQAGEMHHRFNVADGEDPVERRRVADIGAHEVDVRAGREFADARQHGCLRVDEIVDDQLPSACAG